MRVAGFLVGGLALGLVGAAAAQGMPGGQQQEALQWLQRVGAAAQKLSYSGTFIYQSGSQSETSRIVHVAANGRQTEKLEVLDGSPREVIRQDDEVKCYLPENRLVIIEQRGTRRTFPALLPASLAGLGEHYQLRPAGSARVAGHDSQMVRLEPRDAWRYGRRYWVARDSGLLLKADVFDARGEALESLAFTELRLGPPADPASLKPSFGGQPETWQVRQAQLRDSRDDQRWQFRAEVPGFRRQAAMLRKVVAEGNAPRDMLHWVYSDGLAAFSVFIAPLQPEAAGADGDLQTLGAISVMKRVLDGHQIVVMGDVPPAAVQRFAMGIAVRGK